MKPSVLIVAVCLLSGCHRVVPPAPEVKQAAQPSIDIDVDEIESLIRMLSDDLLAGRGIGTDGLDTAALILENLLRGWGFQPLFQDSYRQPFQLTGSRPDPKASLISSGKAGDKPLAINQEFVVHSFRRDIPETVQAELVYVGYGIQAPERKWDDYKGQDLSGKVLLMEVNEPGNQPGGFFDGEAMTYYGRWTYKYEQAARMGAKGALIVHNTKGAGYPWAVVRNSSTQEGFFLATEKPKLAFFGWLTSQAAADLLERAGRKRADVLAAAERRDFAPIDLGLKISVKQKPVFRNVTTENVAGVLPGAAGAEQHRRVIILSAHYDHLGRDANKQGDQIYNGAVDNGSAMAIIFSLGRFFSQHPEPLNSDLVVFAPSAEEQGLLGSSYFVQHLPFDKARIVADINFDLSNVWGETEDAYAIGGRFSDLGDVCRQAATKVGMRFTKEQATEQGFFFRSDQKSFALAGVPAVWPHAGIVSRGKDPDFQKRMRKDFRQNRYHQVEDEMTPAWDLRGTVQLTKWTREIVRILDRMKRMPAYKPGVSFGN